MPIRSPSAPALRGGKVAKLQYAAVALREGKLEQLVFEDCRQVLFYPSMFCLMPAMHLRNQSHHQ